MTFGLKFAAYCALVLATYAVLSRLLYLGVTALPRLSP